MPLEVTAIASFPWKPSLKTSQQVFGLLLCVCVDADVAPVYAEPWARSGLEVAGLQAGPQCRMHNTDYRGSEKSTCSKCQGESRQGWSQQES